MIVDPGARVSIPNETKENLFSCIRLTVLQIRYRATCDCELPPFKGSTLRGSFGQSLKSLSCQRHQGTECLTCCNPSQCPYSLLFESDANGQGPLPYIIQPPEGKRTDYRRGDELSWKLILVGDAYRWLPWVVWSLGRMGQVGLGAKRVPWDLTEIASLAPNGCWVSLLDSFDFCPSVSCEDLVRGGQPEGDSIVRFLAPTQLKSHGETVYSIDGTLLVRRLLRRIADLAERHCGWLGRADFSFQQYLDAAETIVVTDPALRPIQWHRYSRRQNRHHVMNGFVGKVTFRDVPELIYPILRLGTFLNVGTSANFGMGHYVLRRTVALPNTYSDVRESE